MWIVLSPLTLEARRAFTAALVADYVDFLLGRSERADPVAALERAQAEIEAEVEVAVQAGDQFWAAYNVEGATVGWLWVKYALEGLPASAAFLYQILVQAEVRRQGYGAAMLAAVESVLTTSGWRELRLNVWDTNAAARRLYQRAGYTLVEQFPLKRQLHKRLSPTKRDEA